MPEVDKEFNLKDWEWIAVHFPKSEREAMAKVAWLISDKCTPEEISQRKIDPRIVIPLCAIELFDKKDFLQLKKLLKEKEFGSDLKIAEVFASELEQELELKLELKLLELSQLSETSKLKQKYVNEIKQAFIEINLSQKWQSLFETLDIELQCSLLYHLIKYRTPTRDDWRNIFLNVKYNHTENLYLKFRREIIWMLILLETFGTVIHFGFFIESVDNTNLVVFFLKLCIRFFFFLFLFIILMLFSPTLIKFYFSKLDRNIAGYIVITISFCISFIYAKKLFYSMNDYDIYSPVNIVLISGMYTFIGILVVFFISMFLYPKVNLRICKFIVIILLLYWQLVYYFYFSWKISLLIWAVISTISLILWIYSRIYAKNIERKITNPFKNFKL
ncbi:MAG: hypothetical protein F6K54_00145 [Okeania sp. SIO3B5]|uniref:hypothetical protein n=1 Tax=Okeania sp. SIO3B5 TaxID=2607811 RepID=UPI0013FFC0D1|nr:hypothetical protein [Okeania sp. SIO3B5]NEO51646.1 hypothetical protein [Okeania sp. SIO3B5]